MSEVTIVEAQRQPLGIDITQSLDVGITTTRVETFVVPTMDVVRRGVLIGSTTKMGNGSCGVLTGRKLSGSTTLPINYWSCWDTSNGLYQSNIDYSCEYD